MQELESEAKTRVRKNGADENRTTGNLIWADFVHFTARPVNGVPDPHLHAHCYVFNATWDEVEKQWKAGQFRDLKANAPYFEAAFHVRFARNLKEIGFKIERTPKGWELHGVPERVLQEFSKRSEQVEKRADELGITTAKKKDGLAALTRERKQKDMTKAELRDSWFQRVSSDERLAIPLQQIRNCCARHIVMAWAMWRLKWPSCNCCERSSSKSGPMGMFGLRPKKCCRRNNG
jgi:conjugative relaxase-like TrwC/TraI family protein